MSRITRIAGSLAVVRDRLLGVRAMAVPWIEPPAAPPRPKGANHTGENPGLDPCSNSNIEQIRPLLS